jgi:pyruvate ferredoxin oxidoreductase alpha subunit
MGKRIGIEVSLAVSEAAKLANVDVISAYPITPQTHIVEHLSELVADGHLDAEFIPVESEHSAMSACIGASAAGARTFTSTCAQGLALMLEICYIAAALRLPIVMAMANRSLSGPISIWNDHGDLMMARDSGWIQIVAENGQEAFDLTIQAFRIAEDHRVLLPVIVNLDGFTLSHVIEPLEMLSQEEVDKYLPPYKPKMWLDLKNPITMGAVGIPDVYTEAKKAQDEAIKGAKPVVIEAWNEFAKLFGRKYQPVESYKTEGADTLLVTMGSTSETAMTAVDQMRAAGRKVGIVRIRLYRPFPKEEFLAAIKGAKQLAVMDRALAMSGMETGPLATEIKSVLYDQAQKPYVWNFIAGLAGRDITVENFTDMADGVEAAAADKLPQGATWTNVRE